MRANTLLLCCSLILAACALALGAVNFFHSRAPAPATAAPPPPRQEVLPAGAVPGVPSPASLPASETLRVATETVYPAVTLREEKISIQRAAQRICEQAGVEYEFNRSLENCGADCRRYIKVALENATFEEALAQIVLKNGLRYRTEGRKLWLEKAE